MSYCPRPRKTSKTNFGTPATKTVNAPAPRTEACAPAESEVITGGGSSTENTVYVPGPAGPAGPQGPAGWGFKWEGEFEINKQYYKQTESNPLASVVSYAGSTWVAVEDNISVSDSPPEYEPGNSTAWNLVAQKGADGTGTTLPGDDFFGFDLEDVFDWYKDASITDLILAGLGVAGVIWAGSEIIDAIAGDGEGDGQADARYDGSDGYLLTGYTAPNLPEIVENLCDVAGIVSDVSLLPDTPCEFVIGNNTSVRTILSQLALVYAFDMVDTGLSLKFVPRTAVPVKTLTADDMGFGNSATSRYSAQRAQGIDLPRTVTLKYYSEDLDYNTFTQRAELYTYPDGQDVNLDVPLTLPHTKAREIAEVALMNAHLERQGYTFTTTYKHLDLEPGDVVDSQFGLIRITRLSETSEGLLEIAATAAGTELAVEGSGLDAVQPPTSTNVPAVVGYSQGLFIDPNNLNAGDQGVRLYAAVHGYGVAGWPGAQIYVSDNAGASYDLVATTYKEATFGLVATATASAAYYGWDNTTTISVQLKTGSLSSVSELDVLNGKNWATIGQEIIGFKNAVLTAPKTYTLSGLLRGRQGTEQFIGTHVANELFCLLDDAVTRITLTTVDRNKTRLYKVVTIGSSLDKVDPIEVYCRSNNTLPWTVVDAKVTKTGADYNFSWKERYRFDNALRDYGVAPKDPDWGGSIIVIYDTDGVTVKKSYPTTSQIFTYTSAMQTTDFGSPQATIKAAICQYSQIYGPGYPVILNG